ncbi:MAG: tRNA (adenosine(37)-N6)-threonylcarbamoyltransferase complex dimerization subunit type 1 TsaB [Planctomycetota bacterium]|jgi:tRNA threonylcarbamoyladenosine biosynthesis protein TsaB|nr:tRNA (adenosine(37)-N6)-threonylcarbamoyltransferase complex dimerization subunit type 1 TsaB [Planctomycetota bacterium]
MFLALDTSSPFGSVALRGERDDRDGRDGRGDREKIAAVATLADGWQHGRLLVAAARDLLRQNKIDLTEITAVAVGGGPGSYTGTRIGVMAAKTLAWSLQKKLVVVSSLAALALAATRSANLDGARLDGARLDGAAKIVVLQTARADELYCGFYAIAPDGTPRAREKDVALSPATVAPMLDENTVVVGGGWEKTPAIFAPPLERGVKFFPYSGEPPLAAAVAEIAARGGGEIAEPLSFAPRYLRRDESPCRFERAELRV